MIRTTPRPARRPTNHLTHLLGVEVWQAPSQRASVLGGRSTRPSESGPSNTKGLVSGPNPCVKRSRSKPLPWRASSDSGGRLLVRAPIRDLHRHWGVSWTVTSRYVVGFRTPEVTLMSDGANSALDVYQKLPEIGVKPSNLQAPDQFGFGIDPSICHEYLSMSRMGMMFMMLLMDLQGAHIPSSCRPTLPQVLHVA